MPEPPDPAAPNSAARGADAFWAFSLAFYERPGIAETCLELQDRDGLDVNILLLCCWLGWSGQGRLRRDDFAAAEAGVAGWRSQIVERLRSVRRALKDMAAPAASALRREILRLELMAEREAQRLLLASLTRELVASGENFSDAECSLATYLAMRDCQPGRATPLLGALRKFC
jgi:uncharacterized protein (TIGR02444 family)